MARLSMHSVYVVCSSPASVGLEPAVKCGLPRKQLGGLLGGPRAMGQQQQHYGHCVWRENTQARPQAVHTELLWSPAGAAPRGALLRSLSGTHAPGVHYPSRGRHDDFRSAADCRSALEMSDLVIRSGTNTKFGRQRSRAVTTTSPPRPRPHHAVNSIL